LCKRCGAERAAFVGLSADQAASSAPVFGIGLQNFATLECRLDFIEADLLFNHLLLRMLCDPERPGRRLGFDTSQGALEFGSLKLLHADASVSHPFS